MLINFKELPEIFQFDLPRGLAFHVQVRSYTVANVAAGGIKDTVTDFGVWAAHEFNLTQIMHDLSQPSGPVPDWALNIPGVFYLDVDLVGIPKMMGGHHINV